MPKKGISLGQAELDRLDEIKRLVIVAMFSDDELMDLFVLKGGAALDLIHNVLQRASVDVDFSIASGFPFNLETAKAKIENALKTTFAPYRLRVFDTTMEKVPPNLSADLADFWGGYRIKFKIIEEEKAQSLDQSIDVLRRNALMIGSRGQFIVDVSLHEYCEEKTPIDLLGHRIYVYTSEMVIAEKLRAICQQTEEYCVTVHKHRAQRARDFVDIYYIVQRFKVDTKSEAFSELLKKVFDVKRVPLEILLRLDGEFEFHEPDFQSVLATVRTGVELDSFKFYFDELLEAVSALHAFRDK